MTLIKDFVLIFGNDKGVKAHCVINSVKRFL